MKTKTILSLALILIAAGLFGMGSQGALYSVAEDLIDKMVAWSKECAGKTDADCSRDLSTLRKTAFKAAEFPAQFAGAPAANDKTPDGENGWIAHWRLYERLFKYHGECFNRYDSQECREKWATFEKEQRRLSSRYGPEPRWAYFPDALKQRVFRPIPSKHIGDKLAKQWGPIPGTAGSAAVASEPSAASNSEAQNSSIPLGAPAQMFSNDERTITENQNCTVRGVINVVHLPIPDGGQHGTEQGSVTGGYFVLFTPERYTLNGRKIDENGEDKPIQIKNQQIFQLVPDEHQGAKIEAAVTKSVELEVKPFIRNTMYHHTPILFNILSVKILKKEKPTLSLGTAPSESPESNAQAGSAAVAAKPADDSAKTDVQTKLRTDIETALGKSYRNVPRVWEVQFKDQVVSVRFSIDDNLTAGLIKISAKSDIKAILKAVQDAGFPYSEINVIGTLDMQDKFGNSQEDEVVRATYLHSTVNRVNWSGFLTDNIYAIADSVWLHRAFQ